MRPTTFIVCSATILLALSNVDAFVSKPNGSPISGRNLLFRSPKTTATTKIPPSFPSKPTTSTLKAINPAIVSAIGHVLGGNLATPFVINAVNTWYARIPLPSWNPPDGAFAPTWVVLYSLMGVAAARIATIQGSWRSPTLLLWWGHYLLQLLWAPFFFGFAKLRAACAVNVTMVLTMPLILAKYAAIDRTAALLLVPYTAWITFAACLNAAICKLNPTFKGYNEAKFQKGLQELQNDAAKYAGL